MRYLRVLGLATASCCAAACGGVDGSSGQGAGGSAVSGGNGALGGSTSDTGGTPSATGGNLGTGGVLAGTGGAGQATGGAATGGTATGGIEAGGTQTGGTTVGGTATGGTQTGGTATAGTATAGTATGGTESGGAATGGAGGNPGTGGGSTTDAAPSPGCGSPPGLSSGRASIDVNGTMREYILSVPDGYDQNQPYRLIFGWHQLAGSAEFIANFGYYGVEEPSAGQAILVAPEGLIVNDRNDRGWANNGGEDMDFYHAMLDLFFSDLCIDENRIFSTGFSYGAMWSFNLACSPDSMTRAIAPQAGSAFGGCNNAPQVATLAFVGTDDSLLSGHRQAVDAFVKSNACSPDPVEMSMSWCDGLGANNQPCTCVEYQGCDPGYPVISCEYKAGHTFAPNSGQTIWDFFAQF